MAIKILSSNEIKTAKYNSAVKEMEDLQEEVVAEVKNAIDHLIDIDYLYEIKNHINQLLIDWQEFEYDEEDEEDE